MKLTKFGALVASATMLATLAPFGAATAANVEGPKVFWKLSFWGNPRALSDGMEAMIKKVSEETDGNFEIKIFYGEQLSKSTENLDGIKVNAFEGAAICNFYHPGKNPSWMVFSLPFLPLGDPQVDKYVRTKMFEHPAIVADMEKWNAIPYISGLLPQYEFLGNGPAPKTLADWSGKRVRAGEREGAGAVLHERAGAGERLPSDAIRGARCARVGAADGRGRGDHPAGETTARRGALRHISIMGRPRIRAWSPRS